MFEKNEENMAICELVVVCIGEIAKLLKEHIFFQAIPLLEAYVEEPVAWQGKDVGFLVADTTGKDSLEILEREIKSAKKAGVVAVPIVIADEIVELDTPSLLIKPSDFESQEELSEYIHLAIKSVREIVDQAGLINLDLCDYKNFVEGEGQLAFAYGESEQGSQDAARKVIEKASAPNASDRPCRFMLINVTGSEENLSMYEIVEITEAIQDALADGQCNIIWGADVDDSMGQKIRVSIWMRG